MRRVWVTRDETLDGPLCTALRQHGLEPVLEPVLKRTVLDDGLAHLSAIQPGDWLVLTSPFAIAVAANVPATKTAQLAVVGDASAKEAEQHGFKVTLCGPDGHGDTLRQQLTERIQSGSVWHPRSDRAQPLTAWADVTVHDFPLYTTTPRAYDSSVVDRVDLICVTSPSAVQALTKITHPVASIGRSTTAALAKRDITPVVQPETPGFEALAAGIAAYLKP